MVPGPSFATTYSPTGHKGIWNLERHSNPEFDALDTAAKQETDPAKRDVM